MYQVGHMLVREAFLFFLLTSVYYLYQVLHLLVWQGLVQGMITGIRGLCNGLGPAMFGLIFYLFHVDLNEKVSCRSGTSKTLDLKVYCINFVMKTFNYIKVHFT